MKKINFLVFLGLALNGFLYSQQKIKTDFTIPDFKGVSIDISKINFSIDISTNIKACPYPNEGLSVGSDIIPKISDSKRRDAIIKLIEKIVNCEKLPFKEDGQVFNNKEGKLPPMPKGYYREYTLIVPKDAASQFYVGETQFSAYPSYGSRGPERIVIGGGKDIFYTPTHYDSFVQIRIVNPP
ncbi:MAG: ribonuclease domain-containing protein [Elusimicrobiales bacterium]